MYLLYFHLHRGVGSLGAAYRFHSLKNKYPQEYAELKAEMMGQKEMW